MWLSVLPVGALPFDPCTRSPLPFPSPYSPLRPSPSPSSLPTQRKFTIQPFPTPFLPLPPSPSLPFHPRETPAHSHASSTLPYPPSPPSDFLLFRSPLYFATEYPSLPQLTTDHPPYSIYHRISFFLYLLPNPFPLLPSTPLFEPLSSLRFFCDR